MSWTRRDTTNLIRLLKKYNRLNGPDEEIPAAIECIDRRENDPLNLYSGKLDDDILWISIGGVGQSKRTTV